jgi:hypothetical protein
MDCTGTAVAWTRTVLAGVRDFRQDPIALAALAVLDDNDNNEDNNANNVAGIGRQTQGDCQNDPANRASDWRQETMPTKMPTKSRLGATVRTLDDDGPGGDKPTDDESASRGRGRGHNQDGTVGTAVIQTCTVLSEVCSCRACGAQRIHDRRQKHVGCLSEARRRRGLHQGEQRG